MGSPFDAHPQGLILRVQVTPKASQERIGLFIEDAEKRTWLKVYVTVVAESGKANAAVIQLLSKTLSLPKSALSILQGQTARQKVILMKGEAAVLKEKICTLSRDVQLS